MHRWIAAERGGDVVVDPRTHLLARWWVSHRSGVHVPATRLPVAVGLAILVWWWLMRCRLHGLMVVRWHAALVGWVAAAADTADTANIAVPIVRHGNGHLELGALVRWAIAIERLKSNTPTVVQGPA